MRKFERIDKDKLDKIVSFYDDLDYLCMVQVDELIQLLCEKPTTIVPGYERVYSVCNFMLDMLHSRRLFGRFADQPGTFVSKFDYALHWLRLFASNPDNHDSVRNILEAWIYICNCERAFDVELQLIEFKQDLNLAPYSLELF